MEKIDFPKPLAVILLSLAGGAVGAGVLLYRARSTEASATFVDSPQFLVWLFLISLTMVVIFVSFPVVVQSLWKLWSYLPGNEREIVASALLIAFLVLVPLPFGLPERFYVLAGHRAKMALLLLLGLGVALPAMVGIWLVHAALRVDFKQIQADHTSITAYLRRRGQLQRFFGVLGGLISLLTLDTGALRNAVINSGLAEPSEFPTEWVLVYGAFFTVLVAVSYIPTYTYLTLVGRRICDAFFPLADVNPESVGEWHANRRSLEQILRVQEGVSERLQASLVVFAPLLSGIISVLLSD